MTALLIVIASFIVYGSGYFATAKVFMEAENLKHARSEAGRKRNLGTYYSDRDPDYFTAFFASVVWPLSIAPALALRSNQRAMTGDLIDARVANELDERRERLERTTAKLERDLGIGGGS